MYLVLCAKSHKSGLPFQQMNSLKYWKLLSVFRYRFLPFSVIVVDVRLILPFLILEVKIEFQFFNYYLQVEKVNLSINNGCSYCYFAI